MRRKADRAAHEDARATWEGQCRFCAGKAPRFDDVIAARTQAISNNSQMALFFFLFV
jgi:hypothetical protein